jgi:hypothetical protein
MEEKEIMIIMIMIKIKIRRIKGSSTGGERE